MNSVSFNCRFGQWQTPADMTVVCCAPRWSDCTRRANNPNSLSMHCLLLMAGSGSAMRFAFCSRRKGPLLAGCMNARSGSAPQVQEEGKRSAVSRGLPRILPTTAVPYTAAARTGACRHAQRQLGTSQCEYNRRRRPAPIAAVRSFRLAALPVRRG